MSLFSLTFAGGGLILVGAWESLTSTTSPKISPSPPHKPSLHRYSTVTLLAAAALSFLLLASSLLSLLDASHLHDSIGAALHLQSLPVFALFLLFSALALLSNLPYALLNFLLLIAFVEEFLLFYLQRKDPAGAENRYFDLMLIPVSICLFSTMIELKSPQSNAPRLARGIGLVLQGTWLIQMGLSFFTNWLTQNCNLHQKSSGNYTIKCKGHMDDHRAKAIAVLLFNCHLTFIVPVIVGVYSVVRDKNPKDYTSYRPLGTEMQMANQTHFTLDSDDADAERKQETAIVKSQGNGDAMDLIISPLEDKNPNL